MATTSRANRVFPDKVNGLIVDYVGIFRDLQRALAIYGSASGGGVRPGETPIKDKSELVRELEHAIAETTAFCVEHGIVLEAIVTAEGFERGGLLEDARDAILTTDESKKRYLMLTGNVTKLYKAILPDPAAHDLAPKCILFEVLAQMIRSLTPFARVFRLWRECGKLVV